LIKSDDARAIGQYLRRNKELTAQQIATKLENERGLEVSHDTITRHLKRSEYKCVLPLATPMLTENHKRYRIEWAKKHLNTDWNQVIFSDETSYQLFRNTIRRWTKDAKCEKKVIPKNRQKIHMWGAFSVKGLKGMK